MTRIFAPLTENNDHEGESWRFWLQVDGNVAELNDMLNVIGENNEEFELDLEDTASEEEVDALVRFTDGGYMNYENKVVGKLTLPDDFDEEEIDTHEMYTPPRYVEYLYKGGITDLFKE